MSRFEDVLTIDEFDSINTVLKAGIWSELARYQVKPGEERAWGYTQPTTIADVLKGHIKAVLKDANGNILTKGKLRLIYESVNQENKVTYMTFNLAEIVDGKPLVEDLENIAVPYSYLVVQVKPASDFTVDTASSDLEVSTTVYTGADMPL